MASIERFVDIAKTMDPSRLGQLIGPKGSNIRAIEKNNQVLIQVQRNGRSVKVTGQPMNVISAMIEVEESVARINSMWNSHSFLLPSELVGYLIGSNGRFINEVKHDTGVNIDLKQINEITHVVSVYGRYNQIMSALDVIKSRLDSYGQKEIRSDLVMDDITD